MVCKLKWYSRSHCKGGFTRQSNRSINLIASSFDQLNWRRHMLHFCRQNRQLKFNRTPYPNYHFKEQKFFFCYNNYYCLSQNFRVILYWHWHDFSWPLEPASKDGKIITFLPRTCEWSRYRRLRLFAGCYHQLLPVVWSRL